MVSFKLKQIRDNYKARSVILAIGKSGNPRKINCPGEDYDKVANVLADPDEYS